MRAEDPVHRSPLGMWILTRYDDVAACLRDSRFGMGDFWKRQEAMLGPGAMSRMGRTSLFFKDPPDHGRLRGLVSRAFTPSAIERLRPRIEAIVDELLEPARDGNAIDVIRDLAFPLPVRVMAEMLGVPSADRERFHSWTQSLNLSDPEHFPEPERLDVRRENAGDQLSFGGSRHFCLGAPLARLEGAIAFRKLLPLLVGAALDSPPLVWRDSFLNHALESLPVRLSTTG